MSPRVRSKLVNAVGPRDFLGPFLFLHSYLVMHRGAFFYFWYAYRKELVSSIIMDIQQRRGNVVVIIIIAIVVVVAGVGLWFFLGRQGIAPVPLTLTQSTSTQPVSTQTAGSSTRDTVAFLPDVVPYKFPKDFPLYGATTLLNSAVTTLPGTGIESIRSFQSVKGPQDERQFYANYLAANGWKIISNATGTSPIAYLLFGTTGKDGITITISVPQKDMQTVVSVGYITPN